MIGGGQNKFDIFRVERVGDLMSIFAGVTGLSLASLNSEKLIRLNQIIGTKPVMQDDGTVKITFQQEKDDKEMLAFLELACPPPTSSGGLPEVTYEDGTKDGGSVSSGDLFFIESYGAEHTVDGVKTLVAVGSFSQTSGSYNQEYGKASEPTLEFTSIKVPSDLAISAALFDLTVIDATDVAAEIPAIPEGYGKVIKFVKKA